MKENSPNRRIEVHANPLVYLLGFWVCIHKTDLIHGYHLRILCPLTAVRAPQRVRVGVDA